ncbi:Spermidine N(1)-acetyltransferase [Sporomusa ovata DSM 2662]|uniref:GNAT family N-acetyltransferase n=1 Tax=Sporomusa ovata TaxID=2378 RepID=UPI0003889A6B|nr:GNAT family protein [Sporomusa ovata]EQB27123.1 acetyltransferase, including N-acetylases of ribosomal protein [Sporomusa ovata DSM 2662]
MNTHKLEMNAEQIVLRSFSEANLEKSRKWANTKLLHPLILRSSFVSNEEHRMWYQNLLVDPSKIVFAIHEKSSDIYIGNTGFYNYSCEHKRAEFWILIGEPEFWGKGFGFSTLRLMLQYGFQELSLNKICILVSVKNSPAIRLYQRCGFFTEGILRKHYYIKNEYIDVYSMSLLRVEYNELD